MRLNHRASLFQAMKAEHMQSSRDSIHITPAEWRWVILFSSLLILVAFLPFLWVAFSGATATQWQFMGMLNNYRDGATYLSKMVQGESGSWMIRFLHTTEPQPPVFIQVLYPALGHLAGLTRIPPVALFHVARVIASLIMYMALYHLSATIWPHTQRIRARRLFFVITAVGSGLGWLFWPLTGNNTFPDLTVPEMFPFYSSLMNVHFPLTLACLSLIASSLIAAFRPGITDDPAIGNGGLAVGLLSFALSLLYPQALVPVGGAVAFYVVYHWVQRRSLTMRELRWLMLLVLPALPVSIYYAAIITYIPTISAWNSQNVTPAPSPIILILGLGIPLLIALPGLYRAVRQFDQDGDQFMLVWLVAILIAMYLPSNVQRRFAVGMMIPIAYFATRSLESFWLPRISRRWRYQLVGAALVSMTISYFILLVVNTNISVGPFLERDYKAAFEWLKSNTTVDSIVMASEDVSLWVPGWVGARVVYGHPYETLDADAKRNAVIKWYRGEDTADCLALLEQYKVNYIIVGPEETALGQTDCTVGLTAAFHYGSVTIYAP